MAEYAVNFALIAVLTMVSLAVGILVYEALHPREDGRG